MPTLEQRTAVVTGASAGIGRATAHLLSREGARLVLNARRTELLQSVAAETGGIAVPGDLADPAVRARILEGCAGRVDILVNNAGYGQPGPVETVPEADWRRQFEVNVFALGAMIQAVLPHMRGRREGRIINVSSVAGRFGYPLFGWYCASKHAVEGLTDALRLEVAPWGIRAVLIEPGPVETEFFEVSRGRGAGQMADVDNPYRAFFRDVDGLERDMRRRAATAEEVAAVILRACTAARPRARYAVTPMARAATFAMRLLPRRLFDAAIRRQFRVPDRV